MSEKLLAIENLTVSFDGFKAINNLTFNMDEGELRVVIGPNGAGKTTFMDVITGKTKPTAGEVYFKGKTCDPTLSMRLLVWVLAANFRLPGCTKN
ncbi:ATP-binding cassette domain-containing protein [Leptodesmis sp.]|uniref:ATP-binding cassette domain-containing protein n=1 Tax=Leptodesmis sp. TaxID=3100501 RepID=UPI0040534D53